MPAKSERQRRFFGAALSIKEGKARPSGKAAKVAASMTLGNLKEFARKTAAKGE